MFDINIRHTLFIQPQLFILIPPLAHCPLWFFSMTICRATLWISFEILIQFQKAGSDSVKTKQNITSPHFGRVFLKMDPFPHLVQRLVPQTVILAKTRQWLMGTGKQEGYSCLIVSGTHGFRAHQAFVWPVTTEHLQLSLKAARLAITVTDESCWVTFYTYFV